jgi:hypothetical protein
MNENIHRIQGARQFLLNVVNGLTDSQLNHIPAGYSNNIIWNLAHVTATMQLLCYGRSGLGYTINEPYVLPYLPTTKPEAVVSEEDIKTVKNQLIQPLEQMDEDYRTGIFQAYTHSETILKKYGMPVTSIDEALAFVLFHDGMHTGYVLAMKHLV